MKQDVDGSRKLLWKEECKANGGNVKSCSRMQDRNGRLALGENEIRRIWKDYVEDLYNRDTREQVEVLICVFSWYSER